MMSEPRDQTTIPGASQALLLTHGKARRQDFRARFIHPHDIFGNCLFFLITSTHRRWEWNKCLPLVWLCSSVCSWQLELNVPALRLRDRSIPEKSLSCLSNEVKRKINDVISLVYCSVPAVRLLNKTQTFVQLHFESKPPLALPLVEQIFSAL